jgi:hypothetical protein
MPARRNGNGLPAEHAHKQIRDLGQAVKKAVKDVDASYPNRQRSDRIFREYQQRATEISRRRRQPTLPSANRWGESTGFQTSSLFLTLLVWVGELALFAVVAVNFGVWGLAVLTMCWTVLLLLLWPVPGFLRVLYFVWIGLFALFMILLGL